MDMRTSTSTRKIVAGYSSAKTTPGFRKFGAGRLLGCRFRQEQRMHVLHIRSGVRQHHCNNFFLKSLDRSR